MKKFKQLVNRINELHRQGAYHIKRGFSLRYAKKATSTNHLIEETVEYQAEILDGTRDKQIEEASDVLVVFLHSLEINDLNIEEIIDCASKKLEKVFTLDKSKIQTETPGFTRSCRKNDEDTKRPIYDTGCCLDDRR